MDATNRLSGGDIRSHVENISNQMAALRTDVATTKNLMVKTANATEAVHDTLKTLAETLSPLLGVADVLVKMAKEPVGGRKQAVEPRDGSPPGLSRVKVTTSAGEHEGKECHDQEKDRKQREAEAQHERHRQARAMDYAVEATKAGDTAVAALLAPMIAAAMAAANGQEGRRLDRGTSSFHQPAPEPPIHTSSVTNKSTRSSHYPQPTPTKEANTVDSGSCIVKGRMLGAVGAGYEHVDRTTREKTEQSSSLVLQWAPASHTWSAINYEPFMQQDANGSLKYVAKGFLENIDHASLSIGIGRPKQYTIEGKPRWHQDIVLNIDKGRNQLPAMLPKMCSTSCVIEGTGGINEPGSNGRQIGRDYVRIGLPKLSFAPIINTVKAAVPSLRNGIPKATEDEMYYWTNASWGVLNSPATYTYKNDQGDVFQRNLNEAMSMIGRRSAMGVMIVSISLAFENVLDEYGERPNEEQASLSIKCHYFLELELCDYHVPPLRVSADITVPKSFPFLKSIE